MVEIDEMLEATEPWSESTAQMLKKIAERSITIISRSMLVTKDGRPTIRNPNGFPIVNGQTAKSNEVMAC